MREFHFSEGVFELPGEDIADKSATALEIPLVGERRATLVLTRESLGTQTLQEVLDKSIELLGVTLRRFRNEPPHAIQAGGLEGFEFEMTWKHDAGPMFHRVALIGYENQVLTLTIAAADDLKPQVRKLFDTALRSMKFRRKR